VIKFDKDVGEEEEQVGANVQRNYSNEEVAHSVAVLRRRNKVSEAEGNRKHEQGAGLVVHFESLDQTSIEGLEVEQVAGGDHREEQL